MTNRRVPKDDPLIEAYGTLDELQCHLGMAKSFLEDGELTELITELQSDIFTASTELSCEGKTQLLKKQLCAADVEKIETYIDRYTALYGLPKKFLVPGASHESATLHVARAVCRHCERLIVRINRQKPDFELISVYLNRLSDLLFMLAWSLELESIIITAVLKAVSEKK